MTKQKTKKKKKIIIIPVTILSCLLLIVAIIAIVIGSVWGNEIYTVSTFTMLRDRNDDHDDGAVYSMKVKGGFYFDDFIAQGGVSSDNELIGFITDKITKGLIPMSIDETEINCSAFTATTADGDRIFARNYDFAKTNVCITITKNPGKGRYRSFSTVDLNYVGMDPEYNVTGLMNKITCLASSYAPLDGINEAGVSCGIFMSYQGGDSVTPTDQQEITKANFTSTTMLRMILDYAGSVDEAVEIISNYNLHDSAHTSFHYMIADATGKSAILEWLPVDESSAEHPYGTNETDTDGSVRQLVVTYNDADAYIGETEGACDYQWITNFIIQPGYYSSDDDKAGLDRYNQIAKDLQDRNGVVADEQDAMSILKTVGRRSWNGGVTVHSVVYNLNQKTVLWVSNENFDDSTACYEYSLATGNLKQVSLNI